MAELHVLAAGYLSGDSDGRVGSTVSLAVDGPVVAVIDPGLVSSRAAILDPLASHGYGPDDVTDVIVSHHHPDHTLNAALFPAARFHDFWAVYQDDTWLDRPADGFLVSPSVRLMATPGHTAEDISTLAQTADGLVVLTHLWWHADGPEADPRAEDLDMLRANRTAVLALRPATIIPGHGSPFTP